MNGLHQVTKKARMAALKAVGDFVKRLKGTPNVDRYAMRLKGLQRVLMSARPAGLSAEKQSAQAHLKLYDY